MGEIQKPGDVNTILPPLIDPGLEKFHAVMIGDGGTGKTSLLTRYCDNLFDDNYTMTVGVEYKITQALYDGKPYRLQIWDTAGQEKCAPIARPYYRKADGVIIVYDLASPKSAHSIQRWMKEVIDNAPEGTPIILIGNKSDLEVFEDQSKCQRIRETREIVSTAALEILNLPHFECSAKNDVNVGEAFTEMMKEMVQRKRSKYLEQSAPASTEIVNLQQVVEKKKGGCC